MDCETDGLLREATKVHVLAYTDINTLEVKTTHDYDEMRDVLTNAKTIVGHYICMFDIPVLEKLLGITISAKLYDTLPLSWYLNFKRNSHGLESYGEEFGIKKPEVNDWHNLSKEEYAHRCAEDVKINFKLWQNLKTRLLRLYKDREEADRFLCYLTFKMQCMAYQAQQGWHLDVAKATSVLEQLVVLEQQKVEELRPYMPKVKKYKEVSRPKLMHKKDGSLSSNGQKWLELLDSLGIDRTHEEPVRVVKSEEEPNPGSSDQVKDWLFSLGWEPCTFDYKKNADGSERRIPQVRKNGELTDSVKLLIEDHPEVSILDGLTVVQHRKSIFKAFLENYRLDDAMQPVLEAGCQGLTNTLRFKHCSPLVNLPGVEKDYGHDVRGCLIAADGYVLCGADMVSLESTTKRHYMFPYDPDYVADMSQPGFDEHLDLAAFAGFVDRDDIEYYNSHKSDLIDEVVKKVAKVRKKFKAVNYSAIYGVGRVKLSRATGMTESESASLITSYWERNWSIKKFSESIPIRTIGGEMWVQNPVSKFWINLRFEKDVFSSINQSTGVYCFDTWLAFCWSKGLKPIGQFHDEGIWHIKRGKEEETASIMKWAIQAVNNKIQLNVPLDIDYKFGKNYAEVH